MTNTKKVLCSLCLCHLLQSTYHAVVKLPSAFIWTLLDNMLEMSTWNFSCVHCTISVQFFLNIRKHLLGSGIWVVSFTIYSSDQQVLTMPSCIALVWVAAIQVTFNNMFAFQSTSITYWILFSTCQATSSAHWHDPRNMKTWSSVSFNSEVVHMVDWLLWWF